MTLLVTFSIVFKAMYAKTKQWRNLVERLLMNDIFIDGPGFSLFYKKLGYVAHKLKVSFEFSGVENISNTSHVRHCWLQHARKHFW